MSIKNRNVSLPTKALIGVLLLVSGLTAQSQSDLSRSGQWRIAGQNLNNTWSQPAEHLINPANVNNLKTKWVFTTGGDVSATPTVDGNAVYFPDWGGNLFAVDKNTGRQIWSHRISEYDGVDGSISRVSPAVDDDHDLTDVSKAFRRQLLGMEQLVRPGGIRPAARQGRRASTADEGQPRPSSGPAGQQRMR